ncbi:MAG: hypothetical protein V5A72_03080, partial [Candidatus Nanohaloarchaea archaeon]
MGSDKNEEMKLLSIRLKEDDIKSMEQIVERTDKYDSKSDFIRQAIDTSTAPSPDYDLLLEAAYEAREELQEIESEYSEKRIYSLGEHIGE